MYKATAIPPAVLAAHQAALQSNPSLQTSVVTPAPRAVKRITFQSPIVDPQPYAPVNGSQFIVSKAQSQATSHVVSSPSPIPSEYSDVPP